MSSDKPLRIIYIANARIPTERAHGIQIMHTCEALAEAGAQVELVVPRRLNKLKTDPFEYYGVRKIFAIRRLPSFDLISLAWTGKAGFWLQERTFAWCARLFLFFAAFSSRRGDTSAEGVDPIIYIRGEELFAVLSSGRLRARLFLETHMMPADRRRKWTRIFRRASGIVVINRTYENDLKKLGFEKVLCAPDAVTIRDFDIEISKEEARKRLDLGKLGVTAETKLAIYTGHLYGWKGVDTLAQAAQFLPDDVRIVFVGGSPEDLIPFRQKYEAEAPFHKKILLLGQKAYKDMPYYLKAADVLVLPNTAKEAVSKWYTSPIKLFEYMASGRPIVVSDLPSMREVLHDDAEVHDAGGHGAGRQNAFFVQPDNPQELAKGIMHVLQNEQAAGKIARQARMDVEQYSWKKRAQAILDFIHP